MSVCTLFDSNHRSNIVILLKQLEHIPSNIDLLEEIATRFYYKGNEGKALQYYLEAVNLGADPYPYIENLIYCYTSLKDNKGAIHFFESLPPHSEALSENFYSQIALCYRDEEQFEKSIEYYTKAASYSRNSWYLTNIGWCHLKSSAYETALPFLLEVYEKEPENNWNLKNLGYCYQRLKQYEQAMVYYKESYTVYAEDSWLLPNMGWVAFTTGLLLESKKYFEKTVTLNYVMSRESMMNMAHVLYCLKQEEKAMEFYTKSVFAFHNEVEFLFDMDEDYKFVKRWGDIEEQEYQSLKDRIISIYRNALPLKTE